MGFGKGTPFPPSRRGTIPMGRAAPTPQITRKEKKMKNIILIGMPGSGKSTIGVVLAKTLASFFIDTDLIIQVQRRNTLQRLIDDDGLESFRRYEEEALLSVDGTDTVVATGGSAVFCEKGMAHLKENGICVYLKLPLEDIKKRLANIKTRGIAMSKGETIDDVYAERIPLYERYADVTVECHGKNVEEIVEIIAKTVEK